MRQSKSKMLDELKIPDLFKSSKSKAKWGKIGPINEKMGNIRRQRKFGTIEGIRSI